MAAGVVKRFIKNLKNIKKWLTVFLGDAYYQQFDFCKSPRDLKKKQTRKGTQYEEAFYVD